MINEVLEEAMDLLGMVLDKIPDNMYWLDTPFITGLFYLSTIHDWLNK